MIMGYIAKSAFIDECFRDWSKQLYALQRMKINYLDIRMIGNDNVIDLPKSKHKQYRADLESIGRKVATVGSPIGKVDLVDDDTVLDTRTNKQGVRKSFEEYLMKKGGDFQNALAAARIYATEETPPALRVFSLYPVGDMSDVSDKRVRQNVLKFMNMMGEAAMEGGERVLLGVENERKLFGYSPEMLNWLFKNMDPKVRETYTMIYDAMNYITEGIEPKKAYDMTLHRTSRFHVKDGIGRRDENDNLVPTGDGEERFCAVGQGDGGYKEILQERTAIIDVVDHHEVWTLEPHLKSSMGAFGSTKFSGNTGFDRFITANEAFNMLLEAYGIEFR
ncbi:MAG: hypothetical protein JXC85_04325 [Candidatus Aenigmarchaeota archaeon]|nr:hypothetical protein [Candidatus Aenigmarchaeota archaeon]